MAQPASPDHYFAFRTTTLLHVVIWLCTNNHLIDGSGFAARCEAGLRPALYLTSGGKVAAEKLTDNCATLHIVYCLSLFACVWGVADSTQFTHTACIQFAFHQFIAEQREHSAAQE